MSVESTLRNLLKDCSSFLPGTLSWKPRETGIFQNVRARVNIRTISNQLLQKVAIPIEFSNPWVILVLIISSIGGFFFWNTFLAAIASTINDPNSSSRTSLLFLPLMPSVIGALIAFKQPTSLLSLIVTFLPITSPVVLPVRLVLSEVALWEAALALVLLIASTWFMRIAAGKIFRVGMLMYGKEPGLKEIMHWLKSA